MQVLSIINDFFCIIHLCDWRYKDMENYNAYYTNTKDAKYHDNMELLAQIDGNNKFAIELGCGIGRDTKYLLNKRI